MKATNVNVNEEVQNKNETVSAHQDTSRIGTWISVGVVAAVILVCYFVLFGLYMGRV